MTHPPTLPAKRIEDAPDLVLGTDSDRLRAASDSHRPAPRPSVTARARSSPPGAEAPMATRYRPRADIATLVSARRPAWDSRRYCSHESRDATCVVLGGYSGRADAGVRGSLNGTNARVIRVLIEQQPPRARRGRRERSRRHWLQTDRSRRRSGRGAMPQPDRTAEPDATKMRLRAPPETQNVASHRMFDDHRTIARFAVSAGLCSTLQRLAKRPRQDSNLRPTA